jgi:predicted amidohydrolase YtcJ
MKYQVDVDSNGKPTGLLHEQAANYAYKSVPPLSQATKVKALEQSLQSLVEMGITAFQVTICTLLAFD